MDDHENYDETGEQGEIGENEAGDEEAGDENESGGNGTGQKVAMAAGMVAGMTTGAATVASVSAGGPSPSRAWAWGSLPVPQASPPGRLWLRARS